jgi:hypothetical protein
MAEEEANDRDAGAAKTAETAVTAEAACSWDS